MVADYVASIVGQLGSGTFQVYEVVLNIVLERLKGRREAFVEGLTNLGIAIIDREMAEQVVLQAIVWPRLKRWLCARSAKRSAERRPGSEASKK